MTEKLNLYERTNGYSKKLPVTKKIYIIDFFSGCGGISWGFLNTRQSHWEFEILAGLDIDEQALETYRRNIGSLALIQDIAKLAENPENLIKVIPNFNPEICRPLLFIGCPPCQGFSNHRLKDDRDDPRNKLINSFAQICTYYKPDMVLIENVPEMISGRFSQYYKTALKSLETKGYKLTSGVLDLSRYGIPQRRRRAVIFGSTIANLQLPDPMLKETEVLTVRHAISHLLPIAAGESDPEDIFHRAPKHTSKVLERIKKIPIDGGDRRDLSDEDQLQCHTTIDSGETPGFTDVYGRLWWDKPAVTITAKSSTPSCGRFLHPEQHRNISVREAAILQGFPQSYVFTGSIGQQYRQIGEAVPPLFARFLAWQFLNHLQPFEIKEFNLLKDISNFNKNNTFSDKNRNNDDLLVIDSFSGAGGLSLGFKAANFIPTLAFDNETDCVKSYSLNIAPVAIKADVQDVELVKRISDSVVGKQFVMVGGPPCQGFSQQRRGNNNDPRNNLVPAYVSLIEQLPRLPEAVVFENVVNVNSRRGNEIITDYVTRLENMNYIIFKHSLNSADFGVAQLRHRILIVALKRNLAKYYVGPQPITEKRWLTLGETLDHSILEFPNNRTNNTSAISNDMPSRLGKLNKRRISFVDMGKGRLAIPPSLQLTCHSSYDGHLDVYGRLDWFSQARTITAGFDSFTRGEFAHPFLQRSITPREAARIQGFPDWFEFLGNQNSVRHQIGNAVPPPLAYALAIAIRNAFSAQNDD